MMRYVRRFGFLSLALAGLTLTGAGLQAQAQTQAQPPAPAETQAQPPAPAETQAQPPASAQTQAPAETQAPALAQPEPQAQLQTRVMAPPKPQASALAQPQAQLQSRVMAPPKSASKSAMHATQTGGIHVYLLRGWLDVFSTGMDDLTVKLNQRGIRASVHGHMDYYSLADSIADRYRAGRGERVVIIGHSLGANAAVEMAARLGELKINVPLVITYDPTITEHVPANVARLVNFYQSNNGWGGRVETGPGFRGQLSNIDLARDAGLDHVSIDKSNKLHMQSIGYIQSLGGRTASAPKPAPAVSSTEKPAVLTEKPAVLTEKPAVSTEKPAASTEKPAAPVSSQAPVPPEEKRPPL